jgi:hypothetical protein
MSFSFFNVLIIALQTVKMPNKSSCIKRLFSGSRDSVDGVLSSLRAGSSGVRYPAVLRIVLFPIMSRPAPGAAQSSIQKYLGAVSLGVQRKGREFVHSPSYNADVQNEWSYTSTPPTHTPSYCG